MSRVKKDARFLNMKLDREIYDRLEKFCEETGMTKTMATEKIMDQFFEKYFDRPEEERKIFK
jgi:predicted DNA-binding protein